MDTKQIFDWLREQMRNKAYKAWDGDNKREIMLITLPVVENIINKAEAKWEAEVCEWKFEKNTGLVWHCENECESYNISYQRELKTFLEEFECKCPHCGKPIKISEVE